MAVQPRDAKPQGFDLAPLIDPLPLAEATRRPTPELQGLLHNFPDPILGARLAESVGALTTAVERGLDQWVVMYSGGKDSTLCTALAVEVIRQKILSPRSVEIVYADTGLEIPALQSVATRFLCHVQTLAESEALPIQVRVVHPAIEDSFWVCLLGRGYPPPHQKFRWCTKRLKVHPAQTIVQEAASRGSVVVLTGVRYGESRNRDRQLALACQRGGECGQGVWFQAANREGVAFLAPLIHWSTCEVWDFLNFVAPFLGWPTQELEHVYVGKDLRFGCWTCTVVRQDKAMEQIVRTPEWTSLTPLAQFRNRIWAATRGAATRVERPNGGPGRLRMSVRRSLLADLLGLQEETGLLLISTEEMQAIEAHWKREERESNDEGSASSTAPTQGRRIESGRHGR